MCGFSVFYLTLTIQCSNLLSLSVLTVDYNDRNSYASCEALILQNRHLRELRISGSSERVLHQLPWSTVFSQSCQFLQNLILSGCRLTAQETAQLMEVGRRLKKLYLRQCFFIWSEFLFQPQFPMMERLTINTGEGMFNGPVQELYWFAHFPQLRSFSWTVPPIDLNVDVSATNLAFNSLQSRPWNDLQRLELTGYLSDSQVAQILSACGPLQVLEIQCSGFWYRSLAALERHSGTLRSLRLMYCGSLRSWMCQWILTSFPNLTSLEVERIHAHELVMGYGAEKARANQLGLDARKDVTKREQEIMKKEHAMVDELNVSIAWFAAPREVQSVKPWVTLRLVSLIVCIDFPSGPEAAG